MQPLHIKRHLSHRNRAIEQQNTAIASKCSYQIEIDLSYFEKVSIGNPYGVHDDTKKAREASSRAVDALNDIAIDYLATLSLKSAIILSHSGT